MLRAFLKWAALVFVVIESLGLIASLLGLALKLSQSGEALSRTSLEESALEVMLRVAIVGLILFTYLLLRRLSQLPVTVTRQSALLSARAVQSSLLAAIGLYAIAVLLLFWRPRLSNGTSPPETLPHRSRKRIRTTNKISGPKGRIRVLEY